MSTIFSKIIAGEIPSFKIYEDDLVFAFLDIHPERTGHALIVPKVEVDMFQDVPEPYYSRVFQVAKEITPSVMYAVGAKRMVAKIVGTDVPHFHLHLIPFSPDLKLDESAEGLKDVQDRIIRQIHSCK
jgi:histidine triad (HIT) family protein